MSLWDEEEKQPVVRIIPSYVRLTGDLASGTLLSQICYWFKPDKNGKRKISIFRDGRLWLAKNREDWGVECALTLDQVKRAMPLLEKLGFIETRRHLFNGRVTPHICLNEDAVANALYVQSISVGAKGTYPLVGKAPITLVGKPPTTLEAMAPIITETTAETTQEITSTVAVAPGEGTPEMLASKKSGLCPNTAGGNTLRWKSRMSTMYGFQKDLTMKDRAILKKITIVCAEQTPEVIDLVTQKWMGVVSHIKTQRNFSSGPLVPDLGYVLKHSDLILQLIAANKAADEPDPPKSKIKYVYE